MGKRRIERDTRYNVKTKTLNHRKLIKENKESCKFS